MKKKKRKKINKSTHSTFNFFHSFVLSAFIPFNLSFIQSFIQSFIRSLRCWWALGLTQIKKQHRKHHQLQHGLEASLRNALSVSNPQLSRTGRLPRGPTATHTSAAEDPYGPGSQHHFRSLTTSPLPFGGPTPQRSRATTFKRHTLFADAEVNDIEDCFHVMGAGADVDALHPRTRQTALHVACMHGSFEVATQLINNRANMHGASGQAGAIHRLLAPPPRLQDPRTNQAVPREVPRSSW